MGLPGVCLGLYGRSIWEDAEENASSVSMFSQRQTGDARDWLLPYPCPCASLLCSVKSFERPAPKHQEETQKPLR